MLEWLAESGNYPRWADILSLFLMGLVCFVWGRYL